MASSPVSYRIDAKLKARIEREAKLRKLSATQVVEAAIVDYLNGVDSLRKELDEAFAEADKGVFVSGEAVHAWVESWGTESELPMPQPDIFPDDRAAGTRKRKKAA